MADAAAGRSPAADLLHQYLPLLPALAGGGYAVAQAEPLDSGQRNTIARVLLRSAEHDLACIAKFYVPAVDYFFDHHFRREEKILNLLNRFFAGRAPEVYGGLLVEGRVGLLLMEDLGCEALEGHLQRAVGAEQRPLLEAGVGLLADFHTATMRHLQPFYRTVQSIDLDRLNAPTLTRRLEVALGRVWYLRHEASGAATAALPPAAQLPALARAAVPRTFFAGYRQHVVRPLLTAPRGIVHNSFSPAHVLLRPPGPPGLIDFETVALGAAQIDLAELLEAPAVSLDQADRLAFVAGYHKAMLTDGVRRDTWPEFARVYHSAAAARSLDYAGTTAWRHLQFASRGDAGGAQRALERHAVYLARAAAALAAIGAADLAAALDRLTMD